VTQSKRITVSARIYAKHVYPGLNSVKSAKAYRVNIVLSDDEATLNLAQHLVQAARVATELTIMVNRKPSVRNGDHPVTATYQSRKKKQD